MSWQRIAVGGLVVLAFTVGAVLRTAQAEENLDPKARVLLGSWQLIPNLPAAAAPFGFPTLQLNYKVDGTATVTAIFNINGKTYKKTKTGKWKFLSSTDKFVIVDAPDLSTDEKQRILIFDTTNPEQLTVYTDDKVPAPAILKDWREKPGPPNLVKLKK